MIIGSNTHVLIHVERMGLALMTCIVMTGVMGLGGQYFSYLLTPGM